jgi:hypothetical protein
MNALLLVLAGSIALAPAIAALALARANSAVAASLAGFGALLAFLAAAAGYRALALAIGAGFALLAVILAAAAHPDEARAPFQGRTAILLGVAAGGLSAVCGAMPIAKLAEPGGGAPGAVALIGLFALALAGAGVASSVGGGERGVLAGKGSDA